MKIGIDIRTLMDNQYSGVSEYTFNLVDRILRNDKTGNEYKLFYNSFFNTQKDISEFQKRAEIIKTNYPNKIFNYAMQKICDYPKIDKILDVDVFFAPHINFISLSGECKKIITVHDLSFLRYPDFFSLRKNFWHSLINVKSLLKKFDQVVAVSENTKRDIIELANIPEDKVKVIYSGVSGEYKVLEKNDSGLMRVKLKYELPDKFIFYLGNLEPRKNIESIIKAFDLFMDNKEMQDYHLIIAGGCGWKNKEIFKNWKQSRNSDKIKFLGYVDKSDKVYLYNLASVFVYPSFYEGFGFPPLEALASGLPVITGANSSLLEIIDFGALFINPYNINELAEAIKISLSCNMKENLTKNEIIKKFSWGSAAENYLSLFTL